MHGVRSRLCHTRYDVYWVMSLFSLTMRSSSRALMRPMLLVCSKLMPCMLAGRHYVHPKLHI